MTHTHTHTHTFTFPVCVHANDHWQWHDKQHNVCDDVEGANRDEEPQDVYAPVLCACIGIPRLVDGDALEDSSLRRSTVSVETQAPCNMSFLFVL